MLAYVHACLRPRVQARTHSHAQTTKGDFDAGGVSITRYIRLRCGIGLIKLLLPLFLPFLRGSSRILASLSFLLFLSLLRPFCPLELFALRRLSLLLFLFLLLLLLRRSCLNKLEFIPNSVFVFLAACLSCVCFCTDFCNFSNNKHHALISFSFSSSCLCYIML